MKFLTELKAEWKKAVIGLIVVFLIAKWDYVISTFDTGKKIEQQAEFEGMLKKALTNDSVVIQFMENERFVELLFASKKVNEHIDILGNKLEEELHNKIVEDVTKNDSNKVSMRSFVGMEAGVRDEQVLPIISEIVKAWKDGDITTKKDVGNILNSYELRDGKLVRIARF